jgi:hypothetical protein
MSPGWKKGSTSWRRAVTAASSASSSSASSESPPCAGPAIFLYSSQSASLAPNVSSPLPLSKAAVYGREAQGRYEDAAGATIEATSCKNLLNETPVMLLCQGEEESQLAGMFRVPTKGNRSLGNPIFSVQCMLLRIRPDEYSQLFCSSHPPPAQQHKLTASSLMRSRCAALSRSPLPVAPFPVTDPAPSPGSFEERCSRRRLRASTCSTSARRLVRRASM